MVLSASSVWALQEHGSAYYYFARQVVFGLAGLAAMVVLARVDYRLLYRWAPAAAIVAVTLMLVVFVPHVGLSLQGARRWIGLGPLGTLQPSEVAKLVLAVFVSQWVDRRQGRLWSFNDGLLPFAVITAGVLGILMLQRDLGTAVVMSGIFVSIYFAGGARKRHVALLVGAMLVAFSLLIMLESYRQARLTTFLDPFRDPLGASYQPVQALVGLGSGGPVGVGIRPPLPKYLWLPPAPTDLTLAIIP